MKRCGRRDRSTVDGDRITAGKGTESGIDHISNAIDIDREEHVLPYAFMAPFKEQDSRTVPDGGETDCFERSAHQARVFKAITTPAVCNNFGLQVFGIEADRTAEEAVEAFKGDAGDVSPENTGDGIERRRPGPCIADPGEIRVEVK